MAGSKEKTCFISAPFGFDASGLEQALAERNIVSTRLDDLAPGENLVTSAQRVIRQADFVCIVMPGGYRQNNQIFEAGLALGKGRPVLILAAPEVDIPFELGQLTYVRTSFSNKQGLGEILDASLPGLFTRTPRRRKFPVPVLKSLSQEEAEEALRSLRNPAAMSETRLKQIVAELFRKVGILTSPSPARRDGRGPDLAIWIDETHSIFGNPIFVEVQVGRLTQARIDDAYHDLSQHLIRRNMHLGIIVYWDLEGRRFKVAATGLPLVVCFSIEELVDSLRLGTFPRDLIAMRNRAVRGVVA